MNNIFDTVLMAFLTIALIFLILVMIVGVAILLWFMITGLIDAIQERRERKKIKEILNQK